MTDEENKTLPASTSPMADGRPVISLLTRKLAYFPGGQDKSGAPVLIVPVTSNNSTTTTLPTLHTNSAVVVEEPSSNSVPVGSSNVPHPFPPASAGDYHALDQNRSRDLEAVFQYFHQILKEVSDKTQFTVILDGRQACWRLLRQTAEIIQSVTSSDSISALLAIKPELFWEKQHVDCMRDRQEDKVTYVSVPKLHRLFVESSDLPEELGGSMSYQHPQWVHNRLRFEDFVRESRVVMSGLDSIHSRLEHSVALQKKDGGFRLAEWMAATETLYKEHIELARKLEHNGRQLVVQLETDEESGFKLAKADGSLSEYTVSCQKKVKDILSQVRTRVGQSEELYTELQCGIQHATQVRLLETHMGQVTSWILGPGAELLGQLVLRGIGNDSASVSALQQELDNVELKCRETYGKYAQARHRLETLLRSNLIIPEDLKSRKNFMDNVCRTFAGLLERRRRVLIASARFHRLLDQFHLKLADALRVAQTTNVGEDPRAAETAMSLLEDYQRVIGELCNDAESEAQKLLDMLTVPPRDAVGRELSGYDQRGDRQHVQNLLQRIQDGQERLQQAWAMERLRLRRIIEIGTCEKDAQQALSWLRDLCNVMRTSQGRVGCHVSEVHSLKQQQQKFQETARGTYEYGSGLLMAALVLRRSAGLPADNNRHLAAELGHAWTLLLAAVREQMSRLRVAGVFYRDMAQHEKDIIDLMKSLPKLCASQLRHSNENIWQQSTFIVASLQQSPSNRNPALEAFLENRELLLQAVGRTMRLGKLLKGRILDPLLHGEGFDTCPDNQLAAETILNAIVDITNLAQQLDDAICRHAQEFGLSNLTEKATLMDQANQERENEGQANESASSSDEFVTVCESLDKQSSLSCYQTASECTCSDLSRESSPSTTAPNGDTIEKHSILVTDANKPSSPHKKEKSVTFADQVNAILLQSPPCSSAVDQNLRVKPPMECISVEITSNNPNHSSLLTMSESTVLVHPGGRSPSLSEDSGFGTTLSVCVAPETENQDADADQSKDSAFSDSVVDCWSNNMQLPDACPNIQTSIHSDVLFRLLYAIPSHLHDEHAWSPSAFALRMLAILDGVPLDQNDRDTDALANNIHQSKEWLRLTILEMSPSLTQLGETWEEAYDLQTTHHDVLYKLQNKQSPVEELLKQADQLIATQKPKAEVYAAMAESLGQAWKDLNWQLEQRKHILDANVAFHSRARDYLDKLGALDQENQSEHLPSEVDEVKRLLTQQSESRRSALEAHRWALQEGGILLERLRTWQEQGSMDSRPGHILPDVRQAINQVERWLESLHDRRRLSEVLYVSRKKLLDQCLALTILRKDLQEVMLQLQQKQNQLLRDSNLGDSSASAELYLFEHNKLPPDCKELKDKALKLVRVAEELAAKNSYGGEEVRTAAYTLLEKISEYLEAVDLRSSLLSMSITFFRIAQTALTKLDQLEVQLTAHELPNGSPQLAQLHAQVSRALEDASAPALHHGHTLLDKTGRGQPGTEGIQRTVEEIENRGIHLGSLCTAHKEESLRIMQAVHSFIDQYDALYSWLINIAEAFMKAQSDMGTTLPAAREVLDLHSQLMSDMVIKGSQIQGLLQSLPSLQEVAEEAQAHDLQIKIDQLQNTWDKLHFHLESRISLIQAYVRFHALALQVSESLDELENELAESQTENKDEAWLQSVEERWLNTKQKYMQLSQMGRNFIADASQANERFLDLQKACLCIESILDHLGNRQLHVSQRKETIISYITTTKETKEVWTVFITELYSVIHTEKDLDLEMYPIIPTDNASPQTVLNDVERKCPQVQLKASALAANIVENLQRLQQFNLPGNEEAKAQVVGDLMRLQQRIELKTAEYRIVTQTITAFYKNLQEFDRVVSSLKSQQLPSTVLEVDHALQEHSSAKETIAELLRFAGNEADQLLNLLRSQEPANPVLSDIQVVASELPKRQVQWSLYWEERYSKLIQHRQRCQFNCDLHQINLQLDDLMRQLSAMTGAFGVSLTSAQTTSQAFGQFQKTVQLLEKRINSFVSTAQKMLNDEEADRPYIENELAQIDSKWSTFDRQVGDSRKMIDLSLEYFTLVEQVEEWFKEGSKLLVTIARKSTTCKTPAEANTLLEEVDLFLKPGEALQDERINKISTLAIQLYGGDSSRQLGGVLQENRDMIDSFSVINTELSSLALNLHTAQEERVQQVQNQIQVQESLNAARAEAAAAQAAAVAAEEARKAAEAAALLFQQVKEKTPPPRPAPPVIEPPAPPSRRVRLNELPAQKTGPVFTTPLRDAVVEEGQGFTFECQVIGEPVPQVTWLKDGLPIQNNPDYRTSFKDGHCRLSIDETFTEDSAKFTCQASNDAGFAHTSATLKVQDLVGPEFVTFLEPAHVQEGQPLEWQCQVKGHPLPTVSWYKNGVCVDCHPDYVITFNNGLCLLRFAEVFIEDQGEYCCRAANDAGEAETLANLTVEPLEPTEMPRFVIPLSNVMARAGQKVKLECQFKGIPTATLNWFHNGRVVKETRDLKTQVEGDKGLLTITEAFPKDAGAYTVIAKNIAGECSCTCQLSVKGRLPTETSDSELASDVEPIKPSIQNPLKDLTLNEGQAVRLDCTITGQPEPEVIWFQNDRPVKESVDFQLLFQGDRCSLIINEAFVEDSGRYKVVAINSGGEASSQCQLTVLGQPVVQETQMEVLVTSQPTAQPPKFIRLTKDLSANVGEKITLEAQVIGQPSPAIFWYRDSSLLSPSSSFQITVDPNGTTKLTIPQVQLYHSGTYTVRASNEAGEAKCYATVMVLPKEPPAEIRLPQIPPQFQKLFTDVSVLQGTPITLECAIHGQPYPEVKWLCNDRPVVPNEELTLSSEGTFHRLNIVQAKEEQKGRYACVAESEAGKAICTALVQVHQPTLVIPTLSSCPENYSQTTFQSTTLVRKATLQSSTVINSTTSESHTSVSQVEGQPADVVHAQKVQQVENGEEGLSVKQRASFFSSQNGQVTTNNSQTQSIVKPMVKSPRKAIAPKFVTPLVGIMVEDGARVVFQGIVDGHPEPEIKWYKNGVDLVSNDDIDITFGLNKVSLVLKQTKEADAGRYTCTARNSAGTASSTADLVVRRTQFPPVFGRRLQAQLVKPGSRVNLEVEVTGTPPPEVIWTKNEKPIQLDDRMSFKTEGCRHGLVIANVNESDSGRYAVKATNRAGEAQSIADLVVAETQTLVETSTICSDETDFKTDFKRFEEKTVKTTSEIRAAPPALPPTTYSSVVNVAAVPSAPTVAPTQQIYATTVARQQTDVSAPTVAPTQQISATTITRHQTDFSTLTETKKEERIETKSSSVVHKTLQLDTTITSEAASTGLDLTPEPPPQVGFAPKLGSPPKLREDVAEMARKLEEASKTPTEVPGGVRLLPIPTPPIEEKPKQSPLALVSISTAERPKPDWSASQFEPFPELQPFPFQASPAKPKPPKTAPPPKPRKFVKGLSRESDYESDFEGKIPPKWVPQGSDTEDLNYQPVQVRLQSNSRGTSQVREKEPTPPTVFDNPPQIDSTRPQVLTTGHVSSFDHPDKKESLLRSSTSTMITRSSVTTQRYNQTGYFSDSEVRPPTRVLQSSPGSKQHTAVFPITHGCIPATRSTQSMERQAVPKKKPSAEAIAMEHSWVPKRNSGDESAFAVDPDVNTVAKSSGKPSKQGLEMEKRWGHTLKPLHVPWPPPPSEPVKVDLPWMKKDEEEEPFTTTTTQVVQQVEVARAIPPTIVQKTETRVQSQPPVSKPIQMEARSEVDSSTGFKACEGKSFWEARLLAEQSETVTATSTTTTSSSTQRSILKSSGPEVPTRAETKPVQRKDTPYVACPPVIQHVVQPLEPFPFTADSQAPKQAKSPIVQLAKPNRFIKGELRESDYDSDYDGRILPKWGPGEFENEDSLHFREIQSQLPAKTAPKVSAHGPAPTPPTEFESPHTFQGPARPTVASPVKSDGVGELSEKTQRMQFSETTQYSKRFVTMEHSSRVIQFSDSASTRLEPSQVGNTPPLTPGSPPTVGVAPAPQPTRTPLVREPFPFSPDPPKPNFAGTSTPPTRPKRFLPGETRESDYESDYEGSRIRPKWTPACSDAEEPTFKTIKAPNLNHTLPKSHKREKKRSPTPPTVFDQPPKFDGPPRPVITSEDVDKVKEALAVDMVPSKPAPPRLQPTSSPKAAEPSKPSQPYAPYKAYPVAPTSSAAYFSEPELHLQPGEAPEFGYIAAHTTASKMVNQQFSAMSQKFKEKTQNFAEQILTQVNNTRSQQESPAPAPVPIPSVSKPVDTTPVASPVDKGSEPQAYHEESRVSEYGTKHMDPDTGLIYFKYDFGYEFGVVLPGEAKKVDKIESLIGTEGNTEVPVLHEHAPAPILTTQPTITTTNATPVPSTTSSGPGSAPLFKPKRFAQFKAAKWEPFTTDSELSEIEREIQSDKGSSRYYETRRSSFTPYQPPQPCGTGREQHTPSPRSSLSVSPRESTCLQPGEALPGFIGASVGGKGKSVGELR